MRIAPIVGALTFALICLSACAKPATWTEYSYPAWGFAASFLTPPQTTDTPAGGGQPHSFQATTQNSDATLTLIAAAADNSASTKTPDQDMTAVAHSMASGVNGTLRGLTNITLGPVAGREFMIDVDRQPTQRVRVFVANKRIYQVVAVATKGTDDPQALAFLNSFRIIGP